MTDEDKAFHERTMYAEPALKALLDMKYEGNAHMNTIWEYEGELWQLTFQRFTPE